MLKILHTGDIHIGMKFTSYPDNIRHKLVEARFLSLETMIEKANDLHCDIFVISGDLFNTLKISKKDIDRTIKIIEKFNGRNVLILPGNHDYDNKVVDLWRHFENFHSDKIIILNESKEYILEGYDKNVIVYPAPCYNKHSKNNELEWIKDCNIDKNNESYRLGIAHGAIEGLSADLEGNYYPMTMEELENISVDAWLIGHTHIRYPNADIVKNHKIFNAGTPEPDGLNYSDFGRAWYIEVDEDVRAEAVITSEYRFKDLYIEVEEDRDILKILEQLDEENSKNLILRLNLSGRISKDLYGEISSVYQEIETKIASLVVNDVSLGQSVDMELIRREFTADSFPYKFLENLSEDDEALQLAYELIRRK